jgi:hypothetical protein
MSIYGQNTDKVIDLFDEFRGRENVALSLPEWHPVLTSANRAFSAIIRWVHERDDTEINAAYAALYEAANIAAESGDTAPGRLEVLSHATLATVLRDVIPEGMYRTLMYPLEYVAGRD